MVDVFQVLHMVIGDCERVGTEHESSIHESFYFLTKDSKTKQDGQIRIQVLTSHEESEPTLNHRICWNTFEVSPLNHMCFT